MVVFRGICGTRSIGRNMQRRVVLEHMHFGGHLSDAATARPKAAATSKSEGPMRSEKRTIAPLSSTSLARLRTVRTAKCSSEWWDGELRGPASGLRTNQPHAGPVHHPKSQPPLHSAKITSCYFPIDNVSESSFWQQRHIIFQNK